MRYEVRQIRLSGVPTYRGGREMRKYRLAEEVAVRWDCGSLRRGHCRRRGRNRTHEPGAGHELARAHRHPPVRGRIQRPLVGCTRRGILDYLEEIDQPIVRTPLDLTGKYARSRIRLEVRVAEELYPAAASNIARAASLVREDLEVPRRACDYRNGGGEEVVLPLDRLSSAALGDATAVRWHSTVVPDAPYRSLPIIESVLQASGRR